MPNSGVMMAQLRKKHTPKVRGEKPRKSASCLRAEGMEVLTFFSVSRDQSYGTIRPQDCRAPVEGLGLVLLFTKLFLRCVTVSFAFESRLKALAALRLFFAAFDMAKPIAR